MAYLIFQKNKENLIGFFYKFYENQNDLNNSNLNKNDYKIIEDLTVNFDLLKFGKKIPISYDASNNVVYSDQDTSFLTKEDLQDYVNKIKKDIYDFIKTNSNHLSFNNWNNYYNQLSSLDLDIISFPLNKSLEEYLNDLSQPSFNILQLP